MHVHKSFLLLVLACCVAGCGESNSDPIVLVDPEDAEMLAAEQKARDTVDEFIEALQAPNRDEKLMAVKAKFTDNDDVEYMWLMDVQYVDGKFVGTIDNQPELVSNVAIGDQATVAPDEINDWMIVSGEDMRGGYTVKVLMSRQKQGH
jgi:uncharacterized protein YegJ (DUF2314 family)